MRDIGKNIKEFRLRKSYSQEEMAEKLYVTRQTISNYETGKSRPDLDTLIRIADIYGVDVNQLIYGENEMTRDEVIKRNVRIGICAALIVVMAVFIHWFDGYSRVIAGRTSDLTWRVLFIDVMRPLMSIATGVCALCILAQIVKIMPLKKGTVGRKASLAAMVVILVFAVLLFLVALVNLLEVFGADMRWLGPWLRITVYPTLSAVFFFDNWYWFIIIGLAGELIRRFLKKSEK